MDGPLWWFRYKLTLFALGVGVEIAPLIKELIYKLILNFNFNLKLEDEIAFTKLSLNFNFCWG